MCLIFYFQRLILKAAVAAAQHAVLLAPKSVFYAALPLNFSDKIFSPGR
jgi:hypothetical protein